MRPTFFGPSKRAALGVVLLAVSGAVAQLTNNGAKLGTECPPVCGACFDDGSCMYCGPGTMQVGNATSTGAVTCVKCTDPLCLWCGPTVDTCQECDMYWLPDQIVWPVYQSADGRCHKCVNHPFSSGCYSCDAIGRCQLCLGAYILDNHSCKKCKGGDNCIECNPTTLQCTACVPGTGFDSQKQCRGSTTGFGVDRNNYCSDCQQNYTFCKVCYPNYYLSDKQKCLELPEGCETADPHGVCTKCMAGKFLVAAVKKCVSCGDGCEQCASATACAKCFDGSFWSAAAKKCVPCGDGCMQCALATTCAKCSEGTFWTTVQNKCVECGEACERCASATTCAKCYNEYFLSRQKTCLTCSAGCDVCRQDTATGLPRCARCSSLSLVNGKCRRCDDPRCADCSGNASWCKRCRNKVHVVSKATGRCEDPAWPLPCPAGAPGRRGGCTSPVSNPARKTTLGTGRRLQTPVVKPAIVGGRNATRARYPYIASQRVVEPPSNDYHYCGGALVHERVVMLAANCLLDELDWAPENIVFAQIRIGVDKLEGGQYEVRRAKWAMVHPSVTYSWKPFGVSDVALVLLDRPSTMRPLLHLPPAAPRPAVAPGTLLTALGWSETEGSYSLDSVLQEGALERCFPFKNVKKICPSIQKLSTGTCSYVRDDDGFPLIWKGPAGDVAVGVTPYFLGTGCGNFPSVYSDVAVASNWIRNSIQWMVHEDAAGRIPGPATG